MRLDLLTNEEIQAVYIDAWLVLSQVKTKEVRECLEELIVDIDIILDEKKEEEELIKEIFKIKER